MAGTPTPRPYWTPDTPVVRLTEQELRLHEQHLTRWSGP